MDQYLLLLREDPKQYADLSPSEIGALIDRYRQWSQKMVAEGRLVGGHKLADEGGKRLRAGAGKPLVTDGPFIESKDVIGGIFIIKASSYEDAVNAIAGCPHLNGENVIELRRIEAT
ncbi:MAG: YciI family protein [Burkholderiales bacterium]